MNEETRRASAYARRRLPPVLAAYADARGYRDVPESDLIDLIADALLFAEATEGRAEADRILRCALSHFDAERPRPARDPLADLVPEVRARLVDEMGFRVVDMGGRCYALQSDSQAHHVLVSGADGDLPQPDNWAVGIYAETDEAEAIFVIARQPDEFGAEPQPLTLFEAVAAALSIIAEREGH